MSKASVREAIAAWRGPVTVCPAGSAETEGRVVAGARVRGARQSMRVGVFGDVVAREEGLKEPQVWVARRRRWWARMRRHAKKGR